MPAKKLTILRHWPVAAAFVVWTCCLLLVGSYVGNRKELTAGSSATHAYAEGATGYSGESAHSVGRHFISTQKQAPVSRMAAGKKEFSKGKNSFNSKAASASFVDAAEPPAQPLTADNSGAWQRAEPAPAAVGYSSTALPVVSFAENGAVEISVPVDDSGGVSRSVPVPVALELAANPQGLSPQMRDAVNDMALDFLEAVESGAAADSANSEAYLRTWKNAARNSDYQFRMRYGRVAFIQMNLLTAQEAAAVAY